MHDEAGFTRLTVVSAKISPAERQWLMAVAQLEGVSVSTVVRRLVVNAARSIPRVGYVAPPLCDEDA